MRNSEKIYIALIAVFVLAIICIVILSMTAPKPERVLSEPPATEPKTRVEIREVERLVEVEKVITSDIIQDGLNDMGTLITQEYYFTEVVGFSSVKKFLKTDITLPFTESSYLASYDGTVTAGIDFSAITAEKDDSTMQITVHIPRAQIHSIDIDPNSFELYSEKAGVGNPISAADFNHSLVELESSAKAKALERGLLDQADDNAKAVVANFIGSLVDTSVYTLEFVSV